MCSQPQFSWPILTWSTVEPMERVFFTGPGGPSMNCRLLERWKGDKDQEVQRHRRSEAQKIKLFHWTTWVQVLDTRAMVNNNMLSLILFPHEA